MFELIPYVPKSIWNKGTLVGQKRPLKLEETWAIRIRLQLSNNLLGLTVFNLALESRLRACDLIKLKDRDIAHGSAIQSRAILIQHKAQKPVQFEITQKTKTSLVEWINFKIRIFYLQVA
jgi:integrase